MANSQDLPLYLDYEGARYLWQKIVSTFARKEELEDFRLSTQDRENLNSYLLQIEHIPGTRQSIEFAQDGDVSRITHTVNGRAVRTDSFSFTSTSVTETRRLNTSASLTIVTDLDTLATTTTYDGGS